jgi:hypothetical protein
MLAFLPIIGPIIQGIVSIFTKVEDTQVAILKTTQGTQVEEAKVSAQIIQTTQDDIGLRLMRDLVCFPVVVWSFIIGWDTIIVHELPTWTFTVEKYPDSVAYLPYAVLVFLLGNIGINMFNRK